MSTDFDAVCFRCRKVRHAWQHMGGVPSFGYGSKDLAGMLEVAAFVLEHVSECGSVIVMRSDDVTPEFRRIDEGDDCEGHDDRTCGANCDVFVPHVRPRREGSGPPLCIRCSRPNHSGAIVHPFDCVTLRPAEVVMRVAAPVSRGAPVTRDGVEVGVATEDSVTDPERPGYHLVKTEVTLRDFVVPAIRHGGVSLESWACEHGYSNRDYCEKCAKERT